MFDMNGTEIQVGDKLFWHSFGEPDDRIAVEDIDSDGALELSNHGSAQWGLIRNQDEADEYEIVGVESEAWEDIVDSYPNLFEEGDEFDVIGFYDVVLINADRLSTSAAMNLEDIGYDLSANYLAVPRDHVDKQDIWYAVR